MANLPRTSRNIENSIHEHLVDELDDWSGLSIVASQADVAIKNLPVVCVVEGITTYNKVQVGDNKYKRTPLWIIDIYATGDGQRLDLKDAIIEAVMIGIPYNDYDSEGNILSNSLGLNMPTKIVTDTPVFHNEDKSQLSKIDRYRHRISFTIQSNKVEG
jgi:hypothetical protein